MSFKKPALVCSCSCSSLSAFVSPTSCQYSPRYRPVYRTGMKPINCSRRYAAVHDATRQKPSRHHWTSDPHPTPYQIFDTDKHAPYSKARFYELVKIYHPDRYQQTNSDVMTHTICLERYRLVVAANEILSDPIKRRAYDLYGAGWDGRLSHENMYRRADKSWRDQPGNPSMNATWEDWERWYGERPEHRNHDPSSAYQKKQQTVFMSNELFVVVLCVFVLIGSNLQARRATSNSLNIVEMREQKHEAINTDMSKRRLEQGGLTRHERVESFLRQREGWNLGVPSNARSNPGASTQSEHSNETEAK